MISDLSKWDFFYYHHQKTICRQCTKEVWAPPSSGCKTIGNLNLASKPWSYLFELNKDNSQGKDNYGWNQIQILTNVQLYELTNTTVWLVITLIERCFQNRLFTQPFTISISKPKTVQFSQLKANVWWKNVKRMILIDSPIDKYLYLTLLF